MAWPEIGSKWLEKDNRFQRYVEIDGYERTPVERVIIRTLSTDGKANEFPKRTTKVKLDRFYFSFIASPHE